MNLQVHLNILGVKLCIDVVDAPVVASELAEQFKAFLVAPVAVADVCLQIRMHSGSYELRSQGRSLVLSPTGQWPQIDDVVRQMVVLNRRDYVFVHGAALKTGNTAALFVGPSTAGKTTIALRLAQEGHLLIADDTSPVNLVSGKVRSYLQKPNLRPHTARMVVAQSWSLPESNLEGDTNLLGHHIGSIFFIGIASSTPKSKLAEVDKSEAMRVWQSIYRFCVGQSLGDQHLKETTLKLNTPADFCRAPSVVSMSKAHALRQITRYIAAPHPGTKELLALLTPIVTRASTYELTIGDLEDTITLIQKFIGCAQCAVPFDGQVDSNARI